MFLQLLKVCHYGFHSMFLLELFFKKRKLQNTITLNLEYQLQFFKPKSPIFQEMLSLLYLFHYQNQQLLELSFFETEP